MALRVSNRVVLTAGGIQRDEVRFMSRLLGRVMRRVVEIMMKKLESAGLALLNAFNFPDLRALGVILDY